MRSAYEAWDTSPFMLPRPTGLYSLAPIGVGTPMVESLTGYVVRLAEAHCVSAGLLYWKEIRRLAGKGGALVKRGHLMLPSFGALRTFGASHVPGPLPVAELSRCLQAQSLAFGR